jgi:uncharacterized membrane protein YoaK (UPF0700 family)
MEVMIFTEMIVTSTGHYSPRLATISCTSWIVSFIVKHTVLMTQPPFVIQTSLFKCLHGSQVPTVSCTGNVTVELSWAVMPVRM